MWQNAVNRDGVSISTLHDHSSASSSVQLNFGFDEVRCDTYFMNQLTFYVGIDFAHRKTLSISQLAIALEPR